MSPFAALVVAVLAGGVGVVAGTLLARRARAAPPGADTSPGERAADHWPAVLDTLPLGVVVMAVDGTVRFRNAESRSTATTHTGLLVDEAVDRALRRALRGADSTQTLELHGPPTVTVVVRAQPIGDAGAVATIEDISARRRVDAVRTDFVANISHELKTPIGALAILADALADATNEPAVVGRLTSRIAAESERLSRTIDDLMELSRIELGEPPARDVVAIDEIVRETVERVRAYADSRTIELAVLDVADAAPALSVVGDRRLLISALSNLVENAVKYSEIGSVVQIRAGAFGENVELRVIDSGIGIPAAEHERIFERFYRVDRARSRDTGGSGLGLSLVRHIASNHHGEVLVSSEEGRGSTFVLRLPRAEPVAQPAAPRLGAAASEVPRR